MTDLRKKLSQEIIEDWDEGIFHSVTLAFESKEKEIITKIRGHLHDLYFKPPKTQTVGENHE